MNLLSRLTDRQKILILSLGFYLLSLTQKSFSNENNYKDVAIGFYMVIYGWLGLFIGGVGLCWLANPLLILSYFLVGWNIKISTILSGLSTIISFSFLLFKAIIVDEAGNFGVITGYYIGYWLWAESSLIFFAGCIWILSKERKLDKLLENEFDDKY